MGTCIFKPQRKKNVIYTFPSCYYHKKTKCKNYEYSFESMFYNMLSYLALNIITISIIYLYIIPIVGVC